MMPFQAKRTTRRTKIMQDCFGLQGRSRSRIAGVLISLLALTGAGCARSPAFNVLGSYFPGWIACIISSVLLTVLLRWGIKRIGLEQRLPMLPLFYLSLTLTISSLIWLIVFE